MASPQPSASSSVMSSSEESSVMQALDCSQPLVAASSGAPCVQQLNYSEPIVYVPECDQVLDSRDPLGATCSGGVQVCDSSEPLVHHASDYDVSSSTSSDDGDVDEKKITQPSGGMQKRTTTSVATLRSCMNVVQLFKELGTKEQCIRFAEQEGLLPSERMCTYHKRPMSLRNDKLAGTYGIFRCLKSKCRSKTVSRAKGTWFEQSKLAITTLFHLMYMFAYNYSIELARHNARNDDDPIVSTRTVAAWFSHCREAIVLFKQETDSQKPKLGGPGKVVRIDQSKFEKGRYNRGRQSNWVIGMVEDNAEDLRLEVCPENETSAELLVPLIQKHVEEGTEIHTDSWRAYDCLPLHGYIHKKVSHSDLDNQHGTYTQQIKSKWCYMKATYKKHNKRTNFNDWLVEYSWRRQIKLQKKCAFRELLNAIKYVYKNKS